ncbi:hypothetical protein PUNSTDRAFT_46640 [Punctularia strigosozonata HHB-11173 SS5]|uniref:uncharacterized protein n=1 Tax=Punctularia strigosozonata (strain HHB-11173) TaxID=741275 RepID=UPI0004417110|nr:uncharacterized protein PUNSTDRAFT_46640 [Punctularia strigosozonata HHB-11173 SS5]EIN05795.1 hypothetical protein PUNSTDRAFT_46640 [Punctularia strigosozonata HHB-11173 SS5]
MQVVLSAPAENESGTGSSSATPTVVTNGCEFSSCPAGSPPEGFNASDTRLNYVNSFPVDAVRFGIQTLSLELFGSKPDFVFSGPNVGSRKGIAHPLGTALTQTLLSGSNPILPANITLNVNYPTTGSSCTSASSFKWVLSRINADSSAVDVETCGTDHLPTESSVVAKSGCFISVSVMNAVTKGDVDATTQEFVLNKLGNLLSCLT